jgi:putative transposase
LPVVRQCELLGVSRSSVYYQPIPLPARDAELLLAIDKIHTDRPFLGSRRIVDELEDEGLRVNRKAVQRLMRSRPSTSAPRPAGPALVRVIGCSRTCWRA